MSPDQARYVVEHFYELQLEFCGCGSPGVALAAIRDLLDHFDRPHADRDAGLPVLLHKLGIRVDSPFNAYALPPAWDLLLYWLDRVRPEVVEHGTGIGGQWLTAHGRLILEALRTVGDEIADLPRDMNARSQAWQHLRAVVPALAADEDFCLLSCYREFDDWKKIP
jgi:hypothetical protein